MNIFNTYFFYYIYYLLSGRKDSILISFFRKKGISIGDKCHIYSNILSPEPYLVTIKDEVTIAPGCRLITHDNSVCKLNINSTDVFGKIEIGNNCFIGANSMILPGVVISDNTIVAAGAVVTKLPFSSVADSIVRQEVVPTAITLPPFFLVSLIKSAVSCGTCSRAEARDSRQKEQRNRPSLTREE